jgi:periplasmic divalent cation tolerance protein
VGSAKVASSFGNWPGRGPCGVRTLDQRMSVFLIYITTKDVAEARAIGRTLIEERLAACVNILDGMQSLYWWDGAVQDEREALLLAKTRGEMVPKLIARVKVLHSYECPCVVAVPIAEGHPDFLRWVADETTPKPAR